MKSLTDVVSGAGLSGYAEIALVIFLIAFLGVVISLFLPSRQKTYEHLRQLPIENGGGIGVRVDFHRSDSPTGETNAREAIPTSQAMKR